MIRKIKVWLLRRIFSDDERFMLTRAIESRISHLRIISVTDKMADQETIDRDCADYSDIKKLFFYK